MPQRASGGAAQGEHRRLTVRVLAAGLCGFTLAEVNYPHLTPQSQLAIFALLGMTLAFLTVPARPRWAEVRPARWLDRAAALATAAVCGYVVVQTEPAFRALWLGGQALGNRAGQETAADVAVGVVGLVLVLEATRRTLGLALPLLSLTFLAYAWFGPALPPWLLPHRGYGLERLAGQAFLHSQGVFGVALSVMFTYVFLFVLFGAVLEATGATAFIVAFARRLLGRSSGGPAKVAVVASGLMGSLSGSAVANTATTGTFTIPMMRSAGFKAETAAGIEAAASSGGALVPPVMGAGAYMMLEIVSPPVTYLEVIRAALLPAVLYYLSLFLIVHFRARKVGPPEAGAAAEAPAGGPERFGGLVVFAALAALVGFLLAGYTAFRAVTLALAVVLVISSFHPRTRLDRAKIGAVLAKASRDMVPLVAAAACVGIVIGVVTLTGVGTRLPALVLPLARESLLGALALIMASSIVLGMGLPSAVCYLLVATLMGPALTDLGVVPLAAHLFIFYFGMMSMVTPPVALAAYAASSIAGSGVLRTGWAAFRFALVGFTLPYIFVLRPELLMLDPDGGTAGPLPVLAAVGVAAAGILPFAAAIAGYLFAPLGRWSRVVLLAAAALLLAPVAPVVVAGWPIRLDLVAGFGLAAAVAIVNWRRRSIVSSSI